MVGKPGPGLLISDWWEKELVQLSKKARRVKAALMIYTAWNVWKERNRRVFDQKSITPSEVLQLIKNEIMERKMACGAPELSFMSNV